VVVERASEWIDPQSVVLREMESLYEREVAGLCDRVDSRLAAAEEADASKAEGELAGE
jgi:hypothetical protein